MERRGKRTGPGAPRWYFAYGSNMSPAIFTQRRGLRPLAARTGCLDGYRLCFDIPIGPGERGVANLCPAPGARTWGVLYLLTPEDADRLDGTEGVDRGVYRRLSVTISVDGGESVPAFAYESASGRPGRKPSARYLGLLLDGARAHGLPRDYIRYLESFERARDERPQIEEGAMATKTVRFYFAYNSPYSFLASQRLERELARFAPRVEYRPVYSPRTGGPPDFNSPRLRYLFEDVARFAEAYGLQLNPGPFADTKKACLGFFFAREKDRETAYHHAVYRARWLEGRDIGDEETLATIAEGCGLDRTSFLAALRDPRYETALDASNRDAQADEVFGFPFFIYAGKKFWGNDRLEWLVREMERA
jgi:2-hydroxychromene-2-carboxylate isomerase/cation transport regulator ChaC